MTTEIKSNIKNVNIQIPKQDYIVIPFAYMKDGERAKLDDDDLIYMTITKKSNSAESIIQKSLENGINYNDELQRYEIEINSEDTKNLDTITSYGYDITIYYGGNKPRQKVIGEFKIGKKYTLNEVS